ncbi:hypothetical protein NQ318_006823 [Aromia moschata]|uniref:Uncharacterized protein n=1 Tax=Aromia moschata TaxID=1265417 RepID=A0AAV8XTX2_9CUCU|nr:hypothetical protein NQ318_006823 [Aromia moschata]
MYWTREIIAHKFGLHDHQTSTNVTSFFGDVKEFAYSSPVASRAELNNQRLLERVDFYFRRRINLCLRETGDHLEQFL